MSIEVVALVQPEYEESAQALYRDMPSFRVKNEDEIVHTLGAGDWNIVVLHGDDSLVSRVLSNWYVDRERRSRGTLFAAAPVGEHAHIARSIGRTDRLGAFGKALRKATSNGRREAVHRTALYVSDSGLPFRRVAFTVSFGRLARGGFSSISELAEQALEASDSDAFRWVVDGEPAASAQFVVASSLPKAWSTLSMSGGPSFRAGDSLASLVPQSTRLGRVLSKATGAGQAKVFDRIHIDGASGYLLDGIELHTETPGVVEVRPGPKPKFMSW